MLPGFFCIICKRYQENLSWSLEGHGLVLEDTNMNEIVNDRQSTTHTHGLQHFESINTESLEWTTWMYPRLRLTTRNLSLK